MINTYKNLKVWQISKSLSVRIYKKLDQNPLRKHYSLIDQIRRCTISIPSNIAEGYGRKSKKEEARFCSIALGSLMELNTQLIISRELDLINEKDFSDFQNSITELEKSLKSYIRYLRKSI